MIQPDDARDDVHDDYTGLVVCHHGRIARVSGLNEGGAEGPCQPTEE